MNFRALFLAAVAAALSLFGPATQAAPINLAAEGLVESAPVFSGSGGVYYDSLSLPGAPQGFLLDDILNPIGLDDFPLADLLFAFDGLIDGNDTVSVYYAGLATAGNEELFTITAFGFDLPGTLEFLLSRSSATLPVTNTGVGENALLRINARAFDFGQQDPFAFLGTSADGSFLTAEVNVSLIALAPIPLPAAGLMLLAGLAGLGALRRKPA